MNLKKISVYFCGLLILIFSVSALDLNVQCTPENVNEGDSVSCSLILSEAPATISEYGFSIGSLTYFSVESVSSYPTGYTGSYTEPNVGVITGESTTATNLGTINLVAGTGSGSEQLTISGFSMSDYDFNTVAVTVNPSNTITISSAAPEPTCGDGTCDAGETCFSCAVDCGCLPGEICDDSRVCRSPVCTGTDFQDAVLCTGDDSSLTADTAKTLVDSCTADAKCEYVCAAGFVYQNGVCESDTESGEASSSSSSSSSGSGDADTTVPTSCTEGEGLVGEECKPVIVVADSAQKSLLENILTILQDNTKDTLQKISAIAGALRVYAWG